MNCASVKSHVYFALTANLVAPATFHELTSNRCRAAQNSGVALEPRRNVLRSRLGL